MSLLYIEPVNMIYGESNHEPASNKKNINGVQFLALTPKQQQKLTKHHQKYNPKHQALKKRHDDTWKAFQQELIDKKARARKLQVYKDILLDLEEEKLELYITTTKKLRKFLSSEKVRQLHHHQKMSKTLHHQNSAEKYDKTIKDAIQKHVKEQVRNTLEAQHRMQGDKRPMAEER